MKENENTTNNRIVNIDIQEEMRQSYIDYAMSVIVSRALPDVRDGLKPVHRRILYAMHELGLTHDKKFRKCVRVVGDVLAKYHPHGDGAVYNALVRMAQPFAMRDTLIEGQGNFGSIDGDNAAAMRYTESKMTKLSSEMLKDINKETVNFRPNFDGEETEPDVLPARFPNLLVNGANGIAVGMATTIPTHNLSEVINATLALISNPEIEIEELLEHIKGPDFPTGAAIMGMSGFVRGYKTGKGKVIVRSKYNIEEAKNGKVSIIFTEIPYQVNKIKILESIANLVKNKKIDGITALQDESNREGIRIVVELRRDANPQVIVNQLFKHTQLQSTIGMNMIALVDGVPKRLNLKQILEHYVNHQVDVETRRVEYDRNKAMARAHILEGYRIALDNIDEIIKIIRGAYNDAEEQLMKAFNLSEIQAKAIVDMRLRRLQGLEREKIENEYNSLQIFIAECQALLDDRMLLLNLISDNLTQLKATFADERRTSIEVDYNEIDIEDLIEEEEVTVTLTQQGYIKRVPVNEYTTQNRGGRGKTGLSTREEDFVIDIFTTSTHDNLLFFSNLGKVYKLKAYQIPEGSRLSKGVAVINLLPLDQIEKINAVVPVKSFDEGYFIMATRHGIVKRIAVSKYNTSRTTGIIALNLKENDELIGVKYTNGSDQVILVTHDGKSIRFAENEVRDMGRLATGVKGITLATNDYLVAIALVKENSQLLVISEGGYGKRTPLIDYRCQSRGGKGMLTYNTTAKTGKLIGAAVVDDSDELILINSAGVIIRIKTADISVVGRNTSGVKVMRVGEADQLVAFAKIIDIDTEQK